MTVAHVDGPATASREPHRALLAVSEAIVSHRDLSALFHELASRLHEAVRFDYLGPARGSYPDHAAAHHGGPESIPPSGLYAMLLDDPMYDLGAWGAVCRETPGDDRQLFISRRMAMASSAGCDQARGSPKSGLCTWRIKPSDC